MMVVFVKYEFRRSLISEYSNLILLATQIVGIVFEGTKKNVWHLINQIILDVLATDDVIVDCLNAITLFHKRTIKTQFQQKKKPNKIKFYQ